MLKGLLSLTVYEIYFLPINNPSQNQYKACILLPDKFFFNSSLLKVLQIPSFPPIHPLRLPPPPQAFTALLSVSMGTSHFLNCEDVCRLEPLSGSCCLYNKDQVCNTVHDDLFPAHFCNLIFLAFFTWPGWRMSLCAHVVPSAWNSSFTC